MSDRFGAPWGTSVKLLTALSLTILTFVLYMLAELSPVQGGLGMLMTAFPIALVVGCAAFMVRGYELAGSRLLIRRLWWATPLDLSGLRAIEHNPNAMRWSLRLWGNGGFFSISGFFLRWSLRLWGNGGFFSISGFFRNRTLGRYRAFVMDPKRAVVLTFADRVVVVSPDQPERFVSIVREMRGLHPAAGG